MDFSKLAESHRILEMRAGSHLFGTNTPDSDLDLYGIFMPSDEILFGMQHCEEVKFDVTAKDATGRNTKDAVDRTLTEYRKFARLALQNNPNIVHCLFVDEPNLIYCTEAGRRLLAKWEVFLHQGIYDRFVAYAQSQLHKMRVKPENFRVLEQAVEVLKELPELACIGDVVRVSAEGIIKDEDFVKVGDLRFNHGVAVKKVLRSVTERLAKASARTKQYTTVGYDTKFSSNLIQLLRECIEILGTGMVQFPLSCREEILCIKQGRMTISEIEALVEVLIKEARAAKERTKLVKYPRVAEIEGFVMQEVKNYHLLQ